MPIDVSVAVEILTFAIGCAGVGISNWRGNMKVGAKVDTLVEKVEKQNGRLGRLEEGQHKLEITCAANHGKATFRLVPMDGDEP